MRHLDDLTTIENENAEILKPTKRIERKQKAIKRT
jgi:hypothetical protein